MNIWPRGVARTISQQRTLSANLSASQKGLYIFYKPSINFFIMCWQKILLTSQAAFENSFLMSLPLDLTKRVPFSPMLRNINEFVEQIIAYCRNRVIPFSPRSDQDIISPYFINTNFQYKKLTSNENIQKYQPGNVLWFNI